MNHDISVGRSIYNGAYAWVMGEGVLDYPEERSASLSLRDQTLRQDVFLLERDFTVFESEGADASVSVKGDGLGSIFII